MSDPHTNPDPLLSIRDTAAYLDASEPFVREEIRRGRLNSIRLGRHLRVRVSALETYLARRIGGGGHD